MASALATFNSLVDPDRWRDGMDARMVDASMWAALVFGASETAVALLTSTPGQARREYSRERSDRRGARSRRTLCGHRPAAQPHHHSSESSTAMKSIACPITSRCSKPSAWKVYTMYGPPTKAAPEGGWYLDDEEIGSPFLDQVMRCGGPKIICTHKGLGGPIPGASMKSTSPRDIGPAAKAFPEIRFIVYHSGYERNPRRSGRRAVRGEPGWRRSADHERSRGRHRS